MAIIITDYITLADAEVQLTPVLATGPGGQHVNKVSTAIRLSFDARRSPSLPEPVRHRLIAAAGSRASSDGIISLVAERHRSQMRNKEDAILRLKEMIVAATKVPKKRRPTKPGKGARQRRMDEKTRRGDTKRGRGRVTE